MKRLLTLAAFGCAAGIATADPVTWLIDEPWDFYTSTNPPQGNLVGSVTFDRDVNAFWPVAWSFTLEHHDPLLQPYYPITISSALNPSVSSVSGGGSSTARTARRCRRGSCSTSRATGRMC